MGWNQFEVIYDLSDNRSEIIKHTETGLYLKVLDPHHQKETYPADELVIQTHFYSRSLDGYKIPDHEKRMQFKLLNLNSGRQHLWDSDLIIGAVKYYCIQHLSKRIDKLMIWFNGRLMPFEEDYSFVDA